MVLITYFCGILVLKSSKKAVKKQAFYRTSKFQTAGIIPFPE